MLRSPSPSLPSPPVSYCSSKLTSTRPVRLLPSLLKREKFSFPTPTSPPLSPRAELENCTKLLAAHIEDFLSFLEEKRWSDLRLIFHFADAYGDFKKICLVLPATLSQFIYLSTEFGALASLSFDHENQTIIVRPAMRGETPLHESMTKWASTCFSYIPDAKPAFLTLEERHSVYSTVLGSTLPNSFVDDQGRKKMAERFKKADHVYMWKYSKYPGVVFEMDWSESFEDLRRDAWQWLCRTNCRRASNHPAKDQNKSYGVQLVILGKLSETKSQRLEEEIQRRARVIEALDERGSKQETQENDPEMTNTLTETQQLLDAFETDLQEQSDDSSQDYQSGIIDPDNEGLQDIENISNTDEDEGETDITDAVIGMDQSCMDAGRALDFEVNDETKMSIASDSHCHMRNHPIELSFASNSESTTSNFARVEEKLVVDNWVGEISCSLELWRFVNDKPKLVSTHQVLPQSGKSKGAFICRSDIIPPSKLANSKRNNQGSNRFELKFDLLREELALAKKQYAFVRLVAWRDRYLARKNGAEL